jgi:hypothetical protein
MLSRDGGTEAQVATARAQIAHLGRLPAADRADAVKNMRRRISGWRGLDATVKAELLAAIDHAIAPDQTT